jgi:acetyl esterase/lipase
MLQNMDPELREIGDLLARRGGESNDVATSRALLAAMIGTPPADDRLDVTERHVPGPNDAPDVRILLISPRDRAAPSPAVLYLHGGGFVVGSPETELESASALALAANAVTISVDYRLAPENPYPAALEDAYSALTWVADHAAELGVDVDRVAVAGSSAGACLAAAVALLARDRSGPTIRFQHLVIPAFDDRLDTPSMRAFTDTPMWNRERAEASWRMYLGAGHDGDVPVYAAPARASDLSGLPPAYIAVSELDPLRDEGIAYASALLAAGVSVELHVFPGTFHGSTIVTAAAISQRQIEEAAIALRRALVART